MIQNSFTNFVHLNSFLCAEDSVNENPLNTTSSELPSNLDDLKSLCLTEDLVVLQDETVLGKYIVETYSCFAVIVDFLQIFPFL